MVGENESKTKQDEIDHIMHEIEQLQQEMTSREPVESSEESQEEDSALSEVHSGSGQEDESGKLSMNVQGKMTLQLNYDSNHSITLNFGAGALQIQLSNGIEFKIPLQIKSKKAA